MRRLRSFRLLGSALLILPIVTAQAAAPAGLQPERVQLPATASAVLGDAEARKLLPQTVFFRGQTGAVQMGSAVGLRFMDGRVVLIAKVETGGYAANVQEKYQEALITEVPLRIGEQLLSPGVYGAGFLDNRYQVMNLGGSTLFSVPAGNDQDLKAPLLLRVSPKANDGTYQLYSEGKFVVIAGADRLNKADSLPLPKAAQSLQFSDQPDFAIAGITDWTAAGGHGSDATLRTSEEVSRAAVAANDAASPVQKSARPLSPEDKRKEAELRAALAAAPASYESNHAMGEFYLHAGRYAEAAAPLSRAADLHGGAAEDEYAAALACQGDGDAACARQHVTRALAVKDAPAYHRLAGELDEALGDPVSAVEQEQRAAQLEPSEENYFAWGSELLLHRAIWQAAEVFASGVALHPSSPRLKTGWAAALFAGARYDDAAKQLCEASDLKPGDPKPYLILGQIAAAAPATLPCVSDHLERFAQLHPDDADALYYRAMLLLKREDPAARGQAAALLHRAAALQPGYTAAHLQLGILAASEHRSAEAIQDFQAAVAADPQNAEAHYRLGVQYDHAGRAGEAKQQFAIHQRLVKAQAETVDQQRRQLKQFVVTSQETDQTIQPR